MMDMKESIEMDIFMAMEGMSGIMELGMKDSLENITCMAEDFGNHPEVTLIKDSTAKVWNMDLESINGAMDKSMKDSFRTVIE